MDSTIVVAIIGAISAIIVAIVAGYFSLRAKQPADRSLSDTGLSRDARKLFTALAGETRGAGGSVAFFPFVSSSPLGAERCKQLLAELHAHELIEHIDEGNRDEKYPAIRLTSKGWDSIK